MLRIRRIFAQVWLLLALFCIIGVAPAEDRTQRMKVYSNGTFTIDGSVYGQIVIYDKEWHPAYQSSCPKDKFTHDGDAYSGVIPLADGKAFQYNQTIAFAGNIVAYQAQLTASAVPVETRQLSLSLGLPVSIYAGKQIRIDDRPVDLPATSAAIAIASARAQKISIPVADGSLTLSAENGVEYLLQDSRKFGGKNFDLRLMFAASDEAAGTFSLRVSVEFSQDGSLPAATTASADDDMLKAKSWEHTPVIILKLDDLVRSTALTRRCVDYLIEQKVPASFGIIGYSLESPNNDFLALVEKMKKSGLFEFWNHGYMKRTPQDKLGEFEVESAEQQKASLLKTIHLAKDKLGVDMTVFGPHWSGTNHATEEALVQLPQIRAVFYYTKKNPGRDWFVFERRFVLEEPIFTPNLANIKKRFEAGDWQLPYLALQGHPDQWGRKPESFDEFTRIVQYFKNQGCVFMTASQYLDSLQKGN